MPSSTQHKLRVLIKVEKKIEPPLSSYHLKFLKLFGEHESRLSFSGRGPYKSASKKLPNMVIFDTFDPQNATNSTLRATKIVMNMDWDAFNALKKKVNLNKQIQTTEFFTRSILNLVRKGMCEFGIA